MPIIQEPKELVWLARNLKLKVTNYSRKLYSPKGVAYLGSGDDHGKEKDLEAIGQGRGSTIDYLSLRHI